jgi:putative MFS transporter
MSRAGATAAGADLVAAIDEAPFTRRQKTFVAALLAALVFDYMKPFTIAFVIPGIRATWGLTAEEASYLAVAGLSGTVIGSLFWGYMADRIGRKRTLLWTVGIFTAASFCGLSPDYWCTLAFCFAMGFGVGGEAPIVFALATEYLPVRVRGRAVLFIGIIGIVAGYAGAALVATGANAILPPDTAWRAMWLFNLVPGLLILVLRSRVVPESARFLLAQGRVHEARREAESLLGPLALQTAAAAPAPAPPVGGVATLYGRTMALSFFSFAWGLANFGFAIWLPTLLERVGYSGAVSSAYLSFSALIALPAITLTGLLLTRWSTRWTLVLYAAGGAAALVALGASLSGYLPGVMLLVLTSSLSLFFVTSLGGAFSLYAAEVFPTEIRARRSGVVAGAGKLGGVVGPYLGGVWLAGGGSSLGLQIPLALSLVVAAVVLGIAGVETRSRALEQITA